jgi:hypothetical protein
MAHPTARVQAEAAASLPLAAGCTVGPGIEAMLVLMGLRVVCRGQWSNAPALAVRTHPWQLLSAQVLDAEVASKVRRRKKRRTQGVFPFTALNVIVCTLTPG